MHPPAMYVHSFGGKCHHYQSVVLFLVMHTTRPHFLAAYLYMIEDRKHSLSRQLPDQAQLILDIRTKLTPSQGFKKGLGTNKTLLSN